MTVTGVPFVRAPAQDEASVWKAEPTPSPYVWNLKSVINTVSTGSESDFTSAEGDKPIAAGTHKPFNPLYGVLAIVPGDSAWAAPVGLHLPYIAVSPVGNPNPLVWPLNHAYRHTKVCIDAGSPNFAETNALRASVAGGDFPFRSMDEGSFTPATQERQR